MIPNHGRGSDVLTATVLRGAFRESHRDAGQRAGQRHRSADRRSSTRSSRFGHGARRQMDTVEVNGSFYRFPRREVVERWVEHPPAGRPPTSPSSAFITGRAAIAATTPDASLRSGPPRCVVLADHGEVFRVLQQRLGRVRTAERDRAGTFVGLMLRHRSGDAPLALVWCDRVRSCQCPGQAVPVRSTGSTSTAFMSPIRAPQPFSTIARVSIPKIAACPQPFSVD